MNKGLSPLLNFMAHALPKAVAMYANSRGYARTRADTLVVVYGTGWRKNHPCSFHVKNYSFFRCFLQR